jgi:GTP diphosphokinase / guanosine-3',5'-bis(diphosphate) 3'-diphosphatase
MAPVLPRQIREMQQVLGPKVGAAYRLADELHKDEKRKSGEPYIIHPLAVATMLFDAGADTDVICAALLHDVLEDRENTQEIANRIYGDFGDHVLYLVEAVSKDPAILDKIEQQHAYVDQIQRAFEADIFAFFINNMSTISALPAKRKAQWILELRTQYIPLFSEYFHRIPLAHRDVFRSMMEQIESIVARYENDSPG